MSDSVKSYPEENKKMKCVNMIEQPSPKLEAIDNAHPVLLSNPVMSGVGGMLAKQLVSPLRSNYSNTSGCEQSNNKDNSYSITTAPQPLSIKLPSLTLTPSSSLLQSPPSGAAHSNLVSYSRSHPKSKDSSPNHSFSSSSSVDLGSTTTVVISNAIRNASVTLEEDDQSSPASSLVVISDPQARNIETAGYPPSGDQPATIHRIKPAPTSTTTPEGSNLPEASSAPARLVSTEESKMQGIDEIASSTTPSTTVGHIQKAQTNMYLNSATVRIEEDASSTSNSTNANSGTPPLPNNNNNNNNCQNYQHLVGILSTPPIAHNSIMATIAAEAVASPQEHNLSLQNHTKQFSLQSPEQVSPLTWTRSQHFYEE
jgi:hypothetical protein